MTTTTMVIAKPWWTSKTLWINGLTLLGIFLTVVVEQITLSAEVLEWIVAFQAMIGITLRTFTTHPVGSTSGQQREIAIDPAEKT